MPKNAVPDGRIRFGSFEADLKSKELFKEGTRIPLANQTFIALATLLERPGELVSREELRRRLWPGDRVVEFDQGLHAIINRLREALGEGSDGAGLIETLPRRGYRFIGTVHSGRPAGPASAWRLGAGIAMVALLMGLIGWAMSRHARPPTTDLEAAKLTPLTSLVGREVAPAVNTRSQRLLFAWDGAADSGGHFDLYSRALESERLLRMTHDQALALHAVWSPGGRQIAIARTDERKGGVYLLPDDGGPERLLVAANFLGPSFLQLSWSVDERRIAYAAVEADGWSHVEERDATGSAGISLPKPPGCADAGLPDYSKDGRWLAFICTSSVAVYRVYLTDLATRETRSVLALQGNPQGLAWTPKSDAMIVANEAGGDSALWRVALDGTSSQLYHAEGPLGPGVFVTDQGIGFVRENDVIDISRVDLKSPGSVSQNLISSSYTQLVPAYSPDGTRIAFESTRSGTAEIWLADADGRNPVRLTGFNGPLTGAPSWCQDGRRLAFDSRSSGSAAIYILDLFEGRPRPIQTSEPNLSLPVWSQDCRWIIASNGRTALFRVPASGGKAESFTSKRAYRAVVAGSRCLGKRSRALVQAGGGRCGRATTDASLEFRR
jgi:Tol biopolymer transport system component/DNA-binding winged helix-turn-helix (wHTH) protein